jgi:hypothetical protein
MILLVQVKGFMLMKNRGLSIVLSAFFIAAFLVMPSNVGPVKAATSVFSVSGLSTPAEQMVTGSSFSIKGTVKSTKSKVNIKTVTAGITDESGAWIEGEKAVASPKAKSYSLKKLNSKIKFGSLANGTYYYKVTATNTKKKTQTITNTKFTVVTMYISDCTVPQNYYYGTKFAAKGRITAAYKLKSVKVGLTSTKGKFVKSYYISKTPKKTSFDVSAEAAKINFAKVPAGTYYYRVWVQDEKGNSETFADQKFTVSQFTLTGANKPGTLTQGTSYSISGKVTSAFKIASIRIGAVDSEDKWVSGVNASAKPKAKTYSISKVDSKIKFGKLAKGSYKYRISVTDSNGITKNIVNKTFKVKAAATTTEDDSSQDYYTVNNGGKILSYNHTLFEQIGKQPYSGPCGGYAMAYGRMVIDGYFNADGWGSQQSKIIDYYCDGRSYAYWDRADAYSVYYMKSLKANQLALSEVSAGRPCVLAVCTTSSPNHYVTVIGYTAGTTYDNVTIKNFIILDPATGTKRYIKDTSYLDKSDRDMTPQLVRFSK